MSTNDPNPPFSSYRGDGPYAFICYAHRDADEVYADLDWLRREGINVWFDEGISPGRQWGNELADAIDGCQVFIIFISPSTVESPHCQKEITYAIQQGKRLLAIYLEDTHLTSGLALAVGDIQAILKFRQRKKDFRQKVLYALLEATDQPDELADQLAAGDGKFRNLLSPNQMRRGINRAAWVIVVLGVLSAGLYLVESGPERLQTIAVLQFDNFTGEQSNDYISAGIAEEVINLLEKVHSLNVVGRTASFYFAGKDVEFTTIAKRLRADVLLEGSLRLNAGRVRVAAQLINGRTGLHEWSAMFEHDMGDLITMQHEIAVQVAMALEATLTDKEVEVVTEPPTLDNEAYALYLEGRNYLRVGTTTAELETARNLFTKAIDRDAGFIRAQSGLCDTELAYYQQTRSSTDYARASAVCARLVSGSAKEPEAMVALGTLNRLVGNYAEALKLFDGAIALVPLLEPAHYGRGRTLQGLGRIAEAETALEKTIDLQPGFWQTYSGYRVFLAMTGRLPEAIKQFRQVVDLTPENSQGYGNLGTALFAAGAWEDAAEAWRASLEREPTGVGYVNLGTAHYFQGNYAQAVAVFEQGVLEFPDLYRLWGKLGTAHAAVGDFDASMLAFKQAVQRVEPLLKINAEDQLALGYLCVYRVRLGVPETGLPLCERSVQLTPEDPEMQYLYATALRLAGDPEASLAPLEKAQALGFSKMIVASDPVFIAN